MRRNFRLVMGLMGVAMMSLSIVGVASANDSAGFHYGSDGSGPAPGGSSVPYTMVNCGGAYGFYSARIYTYPDTYGVAAYANKAAANESAGYGDGPMATYPLGGPSNDPSYNGTSAEAYAWGGVQGSYAESHYASFFDANTYPLWPIIWADVESGNGGWVNTTLNAQDLDGFQNYLYTHKVTVQSIPTTIYPGVYTTADWWNSNIDTSMSGIPAWTAQTSFGSWASGECASGWTADGNVPHFYGGQTSSSNCAIVWQWISGTTSGDYDQIDDGHISACV